MKIVFMGTPDFAVPTLRRLCADGWAVVGVYSQPDRPSGRGQKAQAPPVAIEAAGRGLYLRQPGVLHTQAELERLAALAPELIVTAAYGKIFRRALLDLPRLGCINLHPSLLPRYRGLSPIPWAILRGESLTGVSVYRMTAGVDSGPLLLQDIEPIRADDTAATLGRRLAELGAQAVSRTVHALAENRAVARDQDEARASFAPRLDKNDGCLDWRLPAGQVDRLVRALDPWPAAYCYWGRLRVKILSVAVVDEISRPEAPGTVLEVSAQKPPVVAALPGAIALLRVQPENGRAQDGAEFVRGRRLKSGDRFRPQFSA